MARAWPKAWSERFEPVLVAAGGMNFGFAGVREMLRLIRVEQSDKPTLVVVILAPGVGQELTIRGRPRSLLHLFGTLPRACGFRSRRWGCPLGCFRASPGRFRTGCVITSC